jgi:ABC-type phosphate transport system substrate-binding protein
MSPHGRPKGEFPHWGTARSAKGANMSVRTTTALVMCAAVFGLAACGEKTSEAVKKSDVPAYQGSTAQAAYSANGWKAGDQAAWDQQLRTRTQGQNEYARSAVKP